MDKETYVFFMSLVFLFLFTCLGGAIWLMSKGKDGWGWLVFVMFLMLLGTRVKLEEPKQVETEARQ